MTLRISWFQYILNGDLYAIPLASGEQSFEVVEAFNVEQSHSISLKFATTMFVKKIKKEENGYIIFYSKYADETMVVVL